MVEFSCYIHSGVYAVKVLKVSELVINIQVKRMKQHFYPPDKKLNALLEADASLMYVCYHLNNSLRIT